MDLPNDSVMERTTLRHLDPVTGERYHMLFNPPPTQEVRDRLTQKPSDTEENIRLKIKEFYANIKALNDNYEKIGLHINADQDPNTVFESLESGIVNQVPKLFSA
jgi:adenylate kinase